MFLPQNRVYRSCVVYKNYFLLFKRVVIMSVNCFHSSYAGYLALTSTNCSFDTSCRDERLGKENDIVASLKSYGNGTGSTIVLFWMIMLSVSSLMEERMLWSLTPVFPLWYFSNRGLFAGLKHTALATLSCPWILQLKYFVGENVVS